MASTDDRWVEDLKKAFSGIGTDEDTVYRVLGEAHGQMALLVSSYPELEDELYSEFSGNELKKALRLFYEVKSSRVSSTTVKDPQWVSRLYDAFNAGLIGGTDEDAVFSVLQEALDVGQMDALAIAYGKQYPGEPGLEDELYDELSGDELKTALQRYYRGLGKRAQGEPSIAKVKIDGTLIPGDSSVPFVPRFPIVKKDSVVIRIDLPPEIAKQLAYSVHLYSSSSSFDVTMPISEFVKEYEDCVDMEFIGTPTNDGSTYALEIIPDSGPAQIVLNEVSYEDLKSGRLSG